MKWEYKTIKLGTTGYSGGILDAVAFDRFMNRLGEQEWELVTAFDTNQVRGATRDGVAIFKRQKESAS